jgi:hypothetical protein
MLRKRLKSSVGYQRHLIFSSRKVMTLMTFRPRVPDRDKSIDYYIKHHHLLGKKQGLEILV